MRVVYKKYGDKRMAERFRKVTSPLLMRRLTTDKSIVSDLPDKTQRNDLAVLLPDQAALYKQTVERCMESIENMTGEDSQTLFENVRG